jgi:hypothetical protein
MIDPLAAIGLVAIGALLVVAILVGAVAWVCRGHRVDLTGVRIVVATKRPWAWRPIGTLPAENMPCGAGWNQHMCALPRDHAGRHESSTGAYWPRMPDDFDLSREP